VNLTVRWFAKEASSKSHAVSAFNYSCTSVAVLAQSTAPYIVLHFLIHTSVLPQWFEAALPPLRVADASLVNESLPTAARIFGTKQTLYYVTALIQYLTTTAQDRDWTALRHQLRWAVGAADWLAVHYGRAPADRQLGSACLSCLRMDSDVCGASFDVDNIWLVPRRRCPWRSLESERKHDARRGWCRWPTEVWRFAS